MGLNAQLLSHSQNYRGAGISGYIYQLLRCLSQGGAGVPDGADRFEYLAFLPKSDLSFGPQLRLRFSQWDTSRPSRRVLWEQSRLAGLARGLDLLHGLAYATPLAAGCPTVVTVHDLSFVRFPEAFPAFNRLYLRWITDLSSRKATQVIAVSDSTRRDLIGLLGVDAGRITVVPNGVTEEFCPADQAEVEDFRLAKGLPKRFILFVGTIEPRKNLVRLIEAFSQMPSAARGDVKLVIGGGKGWFYEQVFRRVTDLALEDRVLFPGFLPADELPWWYRSASLFVYPSLFEGFGLPVLEAMACGVPVITSNTSSLPEVAADAAILINPTDSTGLADAMTQVLGDPSRAEAMRELGLAQAAKFSWRRTALETEAVYKSVLER